MDRKYLILYFSQSGNTKKLAEAIQAAAGGELADIGAASAPDFAAYDLIFAGTPNWAATVPPPMAEFLKGCALAGKKVAPFVTHGMGGLQNVAADMAACCPGAEMLAPFAVKGEAVDGAGEALGAWLRDIGAL